MSIQDILLTPVRGMLGGISIACTIEEMHRDALEVTEHPVERGASITDHSFKRPVEVVLHCGWSNSSAAALFGGSTEQVSNSSMARSDYISAVYSRLLALQESRVPFSVTTTLRNYTSMLITSLQVTRDEKTSEALMVTATCREVILVGTKTSTLSPTENHKNPASTAEVINLGERQPIPATPAPGGSVPSSEWGN